MNKNIFLLFGLLVFFSFGLVAQETKLTATSIMQMDPESPSTLKLIDKLNKEDAAALITQIRVEAKKDYKNIEIFYLLISHLESIKAIADEQKRLIALNQVYIAGLILILGLLGYIIFSQRRQIESIKKHTSE
jgi:hypothetical protein